MNGEKDVAMSGRVSRRALVGWGDPQEQKARQVTPAAVHQQYPDVTVDFLNSAVHDANAVIQGK